MTDHYWPIDIASTHGRIGKIGWSNKSDDFMSNLLNASWGSLYWISWNSAFQCESIQRVDFLIKDAIYGIFHRFLQSHVKFYD